jgi:hypothetical protein
LGKGEAIYGSLALKHDPVSRQIMLKLQNQAQTTKPRRDASTRSHRASVSHRQRLSEKGAVQKQQRGLVARVIEN